LDELASPEGGDQERPKRRLRLGLASLLLAASMFSVGLAAAAELTDQA
jgi:hypothetical protein